MAVLKGNKAALAKALKNILDAVKKEQKALPKTSSGFVGKSLGSIKEKIEREIDKNKKNIEF